MRKAFLLLGTILLFCACKNYRYSLLEYNTVTEKVDTVMSILHAKDDASAYKSAYEAFCKSEAEYSKELKEGTDMTKLEHRPVGFEIRNEDGVEIEPIDVDDVTLWDIKNTAYQSVFGVESFDIGNKPFEESRRTHYNSDYSRSSKSSSSDWKDRMDSDEYEKSLAREVYLEQIGMKDAAKIERNKRREYLRGGGYDSKDGGKQVHYNGSKQQQDDLNAIDEYMREHPEFK